MYLEKKYAQNWSILFHSSFLQIPSSKSTPLFISPCIHKFIMISSVAEQAYLWENNEAVVAWLLTQLSEGQARSVVASNLSCVEKDAIIQQFKSSLEVCYILL
jgi:hypothetical protein